MGIMHFEAGVAAAVAAPKVPVAPAAIDWVAEARDSYIAYSLGEKWKDNEKYTSFLGAVESMTVPAMRVVEDRLASKSAIALYGAEATWMLPIVSAAIDAAYRLGLHSDTVH